MQRGKEALTMVTPFRHAAIWFALLGIATSVTPLRAQIDNNLKYNTAVDPRYGGIGGGAGSPAASGATTSSTTAGNARTPSYNSGDITPIAGDRAAAPGGFSPSGLAPIGAPTRADVSKGSGTLPNSHGQGWRDYNISPYTARVANSERPEQAIVDWVLRETGYEAWHSEPLGVLAANREKLSVYHTPEMHAVVADIADRFVNAQASQFAFTLRVATVRNPNWRARALPIMTPIPVQSPGVQGWLLAKENARLLISELTRRADYREYNSPQQLVRNGQSIVISTMRPRTYVKGAVLTQMTWPGYQPEMGMLEEGFSLEFSPLLALDLASADAVIKLRLNQVEKMLPVKLDLPSVVAPNQRVQVDVPQLTSANFHERFRWPSDQVLLLSMGVVAAPGPSGDNAITDAVTDALPMLKDPPRADALLFIECMGQVVPSAEPSVVRAAAAPQQSFQGRY
jgi:hypothetical protein